MLSGGCGHEGSWLLAGFAALLAEELFGSTITLEHAMEPVPLASPEHDLLLWNQAGKETGFAALVLILDLSIPLLNIPFAFLTKLSSMSLATSPGVRFFPFSF